MYNVYIYIILCDNSARECAKCTTLFLPSPAKSRSLVRVLTRLKGPSDRKDSGSCTMSYCMDFP